MIAEELNSQPTLNLILQKELLNISIIILLDFIKYINYHKISYKNSIFYERKKCNFKYRNDPFIFA